MSVNGEGIVTVMTSLVKMYILLTCWMEGDDNVEEGEGEREFSESVSIKPAFVAGTLVISTLTTTSRRQDV